MLFAKLAGKDLLEGLAAQSLALNLAVEDLKDRYRRSVLGLGWIAVSFLLFVGLKGVIFLELNSQQVDNFLLYLAVGFAVWTLISNLVTNASRCFISNAGWILSANLPYSTYAFKLVDLAALEFLIVSAALIPFLAYVSDLQVIWLLNLAAALGVYLVTGFGLALLLGSICTRYRDIVHAIQTFMRLAFFATPILWFPRPGTILETMATYNPFTYYIAILRSPLMGLGPDIFAWKVCAVITATILLAGFLAFASTKRLIALWL